MQSILSVNFSVSSVPLWLDPHHLVQLPEDATNTEEAPTMPVTPLESLVAAGTKLWLDSIDPQLVASNRALGATGATSNPIIIAGLIKTGRFDDLISEYLREGLDDETLAWKLTDHLVSEAQAVF